MSLLQDALKRQKEEAANGLDSEPMAQSSQPPAQPDLVPPAMEDPESVQHGKEWVAMVVILGGFVLLVVLVSLLGWMLWRGMAEEKPVDLPTPIETIPETTEESIEVVPPDLIEAGSEPEPALESPIPAPVAPPDPLPGSGDEWTVQEQVVADDPGDSDGIDMWPDIRITAAFQSGTGGGTILIDGRILHVGDEYEGVLIHEITRRGVVMRYRGEERLIPVRR